MSNNFLGEIRMFGGNYAPQGWAFCGGQSLSIPQNTALYSLIGTTYGGDGVNTFNLPNLLGRVPVGQGQGPSLTNRAIGVVGGEENVTLTAATMPTHNHSLSASTQPATATAIGNTVLPGNVTGSNFYVLPGTPPPTYGNMLPGTVSMTGGNQPHNNIMPSLCVNFIIALVGIFPSRN